MAATPVNPRLWAAPGEREVKRFPARSRMMAWRVANTRRSDDGGRAAHTNGAGAPPLVIAGLDPAIHHLSQKALFLMDARVKPGHDGSRGSAVGITPPPPVGLTI